MGHATTLGRSGALILLYLCAISSSHFTTIKADTLLDNPQSLSRFEEVAGRRLLEDNSTVIPSDETVRVDPLENLKKYRGGYNISNKHYWSSTVFTGIYGYSIGVAWLLCGLAFAGVLLITALCFGNKRRKALKTPKCSNKCYFWHFLLGFLLTVLAIIASGVALGGSSRFHSKAQTVKNVVLDTADEASDTIYNVTGAIRAIQDNVGIYDAFGRLNSTSLELDRQAANIQRQADKNKRWVNIGLTVIYTTTIVLVSLNLIVVLALLVFAFLKKRWVFHMLIMVCWILTALCWVYFGLYFFIEKFAGDTCTALEEYQQDPSNSSLSTILPCDDLLSAKPTLLRAREGIHDLIDEVNANISSQTSFPLLNQVRICNPVSGPPDYIYQPENCSTGSIRIGDIPQFLKGFTCSGGEAEECRSGEFIPSATFNQVSTYTTSVQNLLDDIPGMESLVDCQLVKDAINEIRFRQCKPVKKYVRMVWAGMVALSTVMVGLILTWTLKAHHDRRNHFSDGSVKPDHLATMYSSESEGSKAEVEKSEATILGV